MHVFRAGEALAAGEVSRHGIVAHHRRLLPGVWTPSGRPASLEDRIGAAWLWSERQGIVRGLAASAMHGARYMVAVEYDGEQHRRDPTQYRSDVLRSEYIDGLGWRRIRVLAGHRRDDIVARVAKARVPRDFVDCAAWQAATRTKPASAGTRR